MKIPVIFADGTPSVVDADNLEFLLRKKGVLSFQRSDTWVRVGIDPIRGSYSDKKYDGEDRRNNG